MATDLIGYLYAATVAAGGIMGYVKAGKYYRFYISFNNRISVQRKFVCQVPFHL